LRIGAPTGQPHAAPSGPLLSIPSIWRRGDRFQAPAAAVPRLLPG